MSQAQYGLPVLSTRNQVVKCLLNVYRSRDEMHKVE